MPAPRTPRYRRLLRPDGRLAFTSPQLSADGRHGFLPREIWGALEEVVDVTGVAERFPDNPFADPAGSWLGSDQALTRALREAGYGRVEVRDEVLPMTPRSGRDWVAWSQTTGMRIVFELQTGPARPALEARIAEVIDAMRTPEGTIEVPVGIRFVVAQP